MKLSTKLPSDDTDATLMPFDDIRGQRYTEIFLIAPAETGELVGAIYNTLGLNDASSPETPLRRRCWTRSTCARSPSGTTSPTRSRTARGCGAWTGSRSWLAANVTSTG